MRTGDDCFTDVPRKKGEKGEKGVRCVWGELIALKKPKP